MEETREEKIGQTEYLCELRKGFEGDSRVKRNEDALKELTYFAPLGKFEMNSKQILKSRIKSQMIVNKFFVTTPFRKTSSKKNC